MAKALYNKPTGNPFEALQHADEVETKATAGKKPDGAVTPSPAERAAARLAANAQKEAEKEASRKQQHTNALLEAQQGPLEGFQVQKGSQPRKVVDRDAKKMTREDYEKNGGPLPQPPEGKKAGRQNDGDNKERKPYQGNRDGENKERKPYQGNRDGGSSENQRKPYLGGNEDRRERKPYQGNKDGPRPDGERKPRGREFDKHSAGKTGNKFEAKRQGGGVGNWGAEPTETTPAVNWGVDPDAGTDKPAEADAQTTDAAVPGWGDEGEVKAPAAAGDAEKEVVDKQEPRREDRPPAWDEEEGHGKMTFAEYEKLKAQKDAELAAKLGGTKELRKVEAPADLSKFVDWRNELADDKDKKLAAKKDQKKGQQKAGVKNVGLDSLFDVKGPGGRGGGSGRGRGGRGGFQDRPPRVEGQAGGDDKPRRGGYQGNSNRGQGGHLRVPHGAKQFPDLPAPQNVPKQTK